MRNSRSYAIVGAGHRSAIYLDALVGPHASDGRLVAVCDSNSGRAARLASIARRAGVEASIYGADDFDAMLTGHKPDRVIITTPDIGMRITSCARWKPAAMSLPRSR
jgi:predicted dehydrogenase